MTGRERLLKLLKGEEIDRIPVVPFIFNNFINEFFNSENADAVEKGIKVYKHFGFDIILRTCNVWDYLSEEQCDSKNWKITERREGTKDDWNITTVITTPEKQLTQKKRYKRASRFEVLEAVVDYYIKDEDDFEQFLKYQPPVPEYDCSIIKRALELLGEQGIIAPWGQGAFNSVSFYRKLDDLILDPYLNPEFYTRIMHYFSSRMLDTLRQFKDAGADMVCCGGNVANSTMVGPDFFKKYVLPYEIEFTKKVKDMGLFYLYHNCGDASKLLQFYSDIKMNIYESLTPPPYGDTHFEDALNTIDPDIILCGNIDQIDFLKKASVDEIHAKVKEVLEKAKRRGNFILGTTDYLSEVTPHENLFAFAKAGLQYGSY